MPFQDPDDETIAAPRSPTRIERLLRKIFVEDWNLKLLALGITLLLWFVVTGQNTPINTHASVQLKFIRPDSLEIGNDPPKSVDVLLTGSKHKLDELDRTSLVASIDLTDQRAGERVLRLADRAKIALLPEGVKIDAFQPSAISIRLEPIIDKQLVIEPKVEGSPAEGYEVYALRPSKTSVTVHGPASHVNSFPTAPTETISLNGRKNSFLAANLAIDISDPKVDLDDPGVNVEVVIGERRVEKTFQNVPVTTADASIHLLQHSATITVAGPAATLSQLSPSTLKLSISGDPPQTTLEAGPTLRGQVVLKSIKPEKLVAPK